MIYAKYIMDDKVKNLLTYDYTPDLTGDPNTVIITEEEYNTLLAELQASRPTPDPDAISDSEALRIITGEV